MRIEKHFQSKLFFFLLFAILLNILDRADKIPETVRKFGSKLFYPIQYTSNLPHQILSLIRSYKEVITENLDLRAEILELSAQKSREKAREFQNREIDALLSRIKKDEKQNFKIARLLAVPRDLSRDILLLNIGENRKVFKGEVAIDRFGVMGQIIAVTSRTSSLMMISDLSSYVPVVNKRNGARGIVAGLGFGKNLELRYYGESDSFKLGDNLVTSGLGSIYPAGYSVGTILKKKEKKDPVEILVQPTAKLYLSSALILLAKN